MSPKRSTRSSACPSAARPAGRRRPGRRRGHRRRTSSAAARVLPSEPTRAASHAERLRPVTDSSRDAARRRLECRGRAFHEDPSARRPRSLARSLLLTTDPHDLGRPVFLHQRATCRSGAAPTVAPDGVSSSAAGQPGGPGRLPSARAAARRGRGRRAGRAHRRGRGPRLDSWRLVVYAYVPRASWVRIGDVQETVRIAEGLEASGELSDAAIERALETLEMFERYCDARGVERSAVDAVATSAIRDAANGAGAAGARARPDRLRHPRADDRGGGALRAPRRRQHDRARRRRRARPRRRQPPARARAGPPRRERGLVAARRRPRHRAAAARRRAGHAQAAQAGPRRDPRAARRRRLARRQRPASRRHRRRHPQPRRRRAAPRRLARSPRCRARAWTANRSAA